MTATSRGTILFTTNYPMRRARAEWLAGREPVQHLWGTAALERAGFEVRILPGTHHPPRGRLAAAVKSRLGDSRAELACLFSRRGAEFAYAADRDSLAGLALARRFGVLRCPLVAVIQPMSLDGPLRRRSLLGYDLAVCLSQLTYAALLDAGRHADSTALIHWGPDLDFSGYRPRPGGVVVSSGKTRRDHNTLLQALHEVHQPARVHVQCDVDSPVPPRTQLVISGTYERVLDDLCGAKVVAIPLRDSKGTVGLTELNDALALGKPVIMTRNPYIDVDLDEVGCGIWVEPGDVAGWVRALRRLDEEPGLAEAMGRRGREFAEKHWNARRFGDALSDAVGRMIGGGGPDTAQGLRAR